jgi:uncharacterized membrane protein YbhN (UPF0104 family)
MSTFLWILLAAVSLVALISALLPPTPGAMRAA